MPTVSRRHPDAGSLPRLLGPRDDLLVREVELSPGRFVAAEGPWRRWTRVVELDETSGQVLETVSYRIGTAHWGGLVDVVLRRPIRRGVPQGATPLWSPSGRLSERDVTILSLCATLSMIAGFLGALVGQTLTYIVDDFGGGTGSQAVALSVIRVGAVLTAVATAMADRRGRQMVLRYCLNGAAIACIFTAAAPNLASVTVLQLVARGLVAAAAFIVPIVVAEELPTAARSYGIGMMLLPGSLGAGMVVWVLPVVGLAPWAWRGIFLLAVLALVLVRLTVRRLPESRAFARDDALPRDQVRHRVRPSRLVLLGVGMYLLNVFTAPTQQLQTDYLKNARDFSPAFVALFLVATNTWGIIGVAIGAQVADRRSRRLAAVVGLLGLCIGNTMMFRLDGVGMWVFSTIGSAVGAAVVPSLGAMLPEMFPTLRRGAANGLLNATAVLGSITGLLLVGKFVQGYNYGPTITLLAVCPIIVAGLMVFMPETSGVDLDDLNQHVPPPPR